jgi:hypothetical protein
VGGTGNGSAEIEFRVDINGDGSWTFAVGFYGAGCTAGSCLSGASDGSAFFIPTNPDTTCTGPVYGAWPVSGGSWASCYSGTLTPHPDCPPTALAISGSVDISLATNNTAGKLRSVYGNTISASVSS